MTSRCKYWPKIGETFYDHARKPGRSTHQTDLAWILELAPGRRRRTPFQLQITNAAFDVGKSSPGSSGGHN